MSGVEIKYSEMGVVHVPGTGHCVYFKDHVGPPVFFGPFADRAAAELARDDVLGRLKKKLVERGLSDHVIVLDDPIS